MARTESERRDCMQLAMKAAGLNPNAWGTQAGVDPSTIRKYLDAKEPRSMRANTARALAEVLGLSIDEMFGDATPGAPQPGPKIWVTGLLGPAGSVDWMTEPNSQTGLYEVTPPRRLDYTGDLVALEIRGAPLQPIPDRWVVFCERLDNKDLAEAYGKTCLIRTEDGHAMFRTVRRGYTAGRVNLDALGGADPIEDVAPTSLWVFVAAADPDLARG